MADPSVLSSKLSSVMSWLSAYFGASSANYDGVASDRLRKGRFEAVYAKGLWQHGDPGVPRSGTGSTVQRTEAVRAGILEAIALTNASSIVDAPCGDLTWMRELFPVFAARGVRYVGIDIARSQVARLQAEFRGQTHLTFRTVDIVTQPTPRAELIFSRQALQHLNAEEALRVLHRWSRSGSRFLLQTQYSLRGVADENFNRLSGGDWARHDFTRPPYNLTAPLRTWPDSDDDAHSTESLALWRLPLAVSAVR